MTTPTPPHFRDRNEWSAIPETEVERLQGTLRNHLRPMTVDMRKPDRIEFLRTLLAKQNQTCAFGKNVAGMYCWNHTKDNYANGMYTEKTYLKLEWGHIRPRSRKEEQTVHDLFLLCARCNNHIQSSRRLEQIKAELLSKIEHIDSIMSSASS